MISGELHMTIINSDVNTIKVFFISHIGQSTPEKSVQMISPQGKAGLESSLKQHFLLPCLLVLKQSTDTTKHC